MTAEQQKARQYKQGLTEGHAGVVRYLSHKRGEDADVLLCNDELVLYNWEEEVRQVWDNTAAKTSAKRFTKVKEVCPGSGGSIYLRHRPLAYQCPSHVT